MKPPDVNFLIAGIFWRKTCSRICHMESLLPPKEISQTNFEQSAVTFEEKMEIVLGSVRQRVGAIFIIVAQTGNAKFADNQNHQAEVSGRR